MMILPADVTGFIPYAVELPFRARCLRRRPSPPCVPGRPDDGYPPFQQQGIELLLRVLRESPVPVDIVSFGSARPVAVAFNRDPDLLREKVREIYLCEGSAPAGYLEWNVYLDPHAFVRMLRSGLNITIYPCATEQGPFQGLGTCPSSA